VDRSTVEVDLDDSKAYGWLPRKSQDREHKMHIGLIGGIGPAATEFYYRGLTDRHAKSGTRLELTIANAEVRDLSQSLANNDARRQAGIFAALISRLKAAGAQVAAVSSMGGHFCIGELLPISPLPILNGIPEVDAAVSRGAFNTIGIIGTRMVMETRLYGAISSATAVVPLGAELDEVHDNYVAMATAGRVNDAQRRVFFAAGKRLCREQNAEVVLLGGTDLFLAFQDRDAGFPVLDCADVHVEAIYQASLRTA